MSVEAISWALSQPVERSSAKFVLVAMANCAGPDFQCWPSMGYLTEATSQDRKTVLENVKRLIEAGYIAATDGRKGKTNQVVVYQLHTPSEDTKKRNSPKNGTVPKTEAKSPVFPAKESRFSVETVPKTGHGTIKETSIEPSGKQRQPARKRADSLPCPDGVTDDTWADWLLLRKAKRAPVSGTVLRQAQAEAIKAGISLEGFLRIWCARGSQGLEAAWLKPQERQDYMSRKEAEAAKWMHPQRTDFEYIDMEATNAPPALR